MRLIDFDHVQLAMPAGEEQRAREFFVGLLGLRGCKEIADAISATLSGALWPIACRRWSPQRVNSSRSVTEVPKPEPLRARGGAWFESGALRLHLGVEPEFRPARKAHPAIRVEGLKELRERALAAGLAPTEIQNLEGVRRMFLDDPFGNRVEFVGAGA